MAVSVFNQFLRSTGCRGVREKITKCDMGEGAQNNYAVLRLTY